MKPRVGVVFVLVTATLVQSRAVCSSVQPRVPEAPQIRITGQYRNHDLGFSVTVPAGLSGTNLAPPAPRHGFSITLGSPNDELLVNAEHDVLFRGSADALAGESEGNLRARQPQLAISSRKLTKLDGLDAVETVLEDGARGGPVTYARQIVALRPQADGVGIVYAITLKQRARTKSADDALSRVAESFRLREITGGTSPKASRVLQGQSSIVGCFAAQDWARAILVDPGIRIGDPVDVKFGRGHIPGMGGDAKSDVNDVQAMLIGPGGQHGYLVLATRHPDGTVIVTNPFMVYTLDRYRGHWSAGEGNGGIGTYTAMGRYADSLDKQEAVRLRLQPTPGPHCRSDIDSVLVK